MSLSHLKKSNVEKAFDAVNYLYMLLLIIVTLYPLLYVIFASFSNGFALMRHSGLLFYPLEFTLSAYKTVIDYPIIWTGYINTIFLLVVGVSFQLFMTCIGAYFLSRKNVMLKKPIVMTIVFTMFFSGGIVPFYLTVHDLGLLDSRWALIFPFAINTYNMIIMRTSFNSLPEELMESARIDGAGHFTVLFSIIIPLSKAVIAVIFLYYAVAVWNAWFWASKLIRTREFYPLQVVLREIIILGEVERLTGDYAQQDREAIGESIKYAAIIITTLPILAMYPFLQKYFVKGVMIGSLKG